MKYMTWYSSYDNFVKMKPPQNFNPYYQPYFEGQRDFQYALNVFGNSEEYKDNIVKIRLFKGDGG